MDHFFNDYKTLSKTSIKQNSLLSMLWYPKLFDFINTLGNTAVTNVSIYMEQLLIKPLNPFEVCGFPETCNIWKLNNLFKKSIFFYLYYFFVTTDPLKTGIINNYGPGVCYGTQQKHQRQQRKILSYHSHYIFTGYALVPNESSFWFY